MDIRDELGLIFGVMALVVTAFGVLLILARGVTQAARRVYEAPGRLIGWVRTRGTGAMVDRVFLAAAVMTLLWVFGAMAQFTPEGLAYWTSAVLGSVVAVAALFIGLRGFSRQFPGLVRCIPGVQRHPRLVAAAALAVPLAVLWGGGTAQVLQDHPGAELVGGGTWVSFGLVHLYLGAWVWLGTLLVRLQTEDGLQRPQVGGGAHAPVEPTGSRP